VRAENVSKQRKNERTEGRPRGLSCATQEEEMPRCLNSRLLQTTPQIRTIKVPCKQLIIIQIYIHEVHAVDLSRLFEGMNSIKSYLKIFDGDKCKRRDLWARHPCWQCTLEEHCLKSPHPPDRTCCNITTN
jgi:hypothetical protein